ncbi:MAG: DUF5668 domain-containing protein [Candidatus Eisenbacteria bacterium]|nr:DUF5668 domain-containing protein [Candidatus Eisenbacteria bacterium]
MEFHCRRRIFFPLFLVLLGLLLLLDNLGTLDFGNVVSTWWPSILILIGLSKLFGDRSRGSSFAIILILLGLFLQLDQFGVVNLSSVYHLWPIILIVLGITMLYRRLGGRHGNTGSSFSSDVIGVTAFFGGVEGSVTSTEFKGGDITAMFGGAKLDLTKAQLAQDAHLDVTTCCGGVELFIPEDWNLIVKVTPLLGSVSDKRRKSGSAGTSGQKTLKISGTVIMGGIDIKS